jgi:hypothetical protein
MKTAIVILLALIISGCLQSPKAPTPKISEDGKKAKYEYMRLTNDVEVEIVGSTVKIPKQDLKVALLDVDWHFYKAKITVPGYKGGCGLAISQLYENRYGFWVNRYGTFGTIPMIENHDVQGVEYEIVEIEEDI